MHLLYPPAIPAFENPVIVGLIHVRGGGNFWARELGEWVERGDIVKCERDTITKPKTSEAKKRRGTQKTLESA